MVIIKDAEISPTYKIVNVTGYGQFTTPKEVKLQIYSHHVALPEKENDSTVIQHLRECELTFNREVFLAFAKQVCDLKKWLEERPPDANENTQKEYTKEDHLAEWLKPD